MHWAVDSSTSLCQAVMVACQATHVASDVTGTNAESMFSYMPAVMRVVYAKSSTSMNVMRLREGDCGLKVT